MHTVQKIVYQTDHKKVKRTVQKSGQKHLSMSTTSQGPVLKRK
jgi:hypothetical protein